MLIDFFKIFYKYILRNPYLSDCLSNFKGPVLPAVALGGFLKPGDPLTKRSRFHEANALIVTFLVKNNKDRKQVRTSGELALIIINDLG